MGAPAGVEDPTHSLPPRHATLGSQLLQCWCVHGNARRMLSVNPERLGDTCCLNGVRGVSMALVVLGHTLLWMTDTGLLNPGAVFPPSGAFTSYTFQVRMRRHIQYTHRHTQAHTDTHRHILVFTHIFTHLHTGTYTHAHTPVRKLSPPT